MFRAHPSNGYMRIEAAQRHKTGHSAICLRRSNGAEGEIISGARRALGRRRTLEIGFTLLLAILLVVAALGRHPYGFYVALRTAATVQVIVAAFRKETVAPAAP